MRLRRKAGAAPVLPPAVLPCRGAAPGRGAGEGETDAGEVEEAVAGGDGEEGGVGGACEVTVNGIVLGVTREGSDVLISTLLVLHLTTLQLF
ncbi:unnamed protein product [Miscanthus lutarioriparius]|uniref:Uncharacterized protein n=1 Tax=Miscanthus lutarioriparius TaxID=422564 RepID=A0A811N8P5_9POAL|nr:unnamed protein product [Miscanthus lutarioriparius]